MANEIRKTTNTKEEELKENPHVKIIETFPEARELADKIKTLQEEKKLLLKENKDLRIKVGRLLCEKDELEGRIEILEQDLAELEGQGRYKELYLSHAVALRAHLMDV